MFPISLTSVGSHMCSHMCVSPGEYMCRHHEHTTTVQRARSSPRPIIPSSTLCPQKDSYSSPSGTMTFIKSSPPPHTLTPHTPTPWPSHLFPIVFSPLATWLLLRKHSSVRNFSRLSFHVSSSLECITLYSFPVIVPKLETCNFTLKSHFSSFLPKPTLSSEANSPSPTLCSTSSQTSSSHPSPTSPITTVIQIPLLFHSDHSFK